ncbi:hypothetical protein NDU88_006376 [Pleurodeles waltl]|uniref:Uncharacterized protein n=1 Tax=Pleurodeles waltl TaxID=8319 RepID=A0AAV7X052_PLEWA|nr:hypothetical protein NDU88_006376 [Pleurodeles waltl]
MSLIKRKGRTENCALLFVLLLEEHVSLLWFCLGAGPGAFSVICPFVLCALIALLIRDDAGHDGSLRGRVVPCNSVLWTASALEAFGSGCREPAGSAPTTPQSLPHPPASAVTSGAGPRIWGTSSKPHLLRRQHSHPGSRDVPRVRGDHGSSLRPDPGSKGRSCGPATRAGGPRPFSLGSAAPRVAARSPACGAHCLGLVRSDVGAPLRSSGALHF